MKVYNVNNPKKFFDVVDTCKGKVELITENGDRLNLKSKLSQFVSITNLFASQENIPEMEIVASEPEDMSKLFMYLVERKAS